MIKELQLVNWKSFDETTLYIDPLTILIGVNASGKSNVLDALLLLKKLASGKSIGAAINGDQESSGIRGGYAWAIRHGEKKATIKILIESKMDSNIEYRYEITFGKTQDNRIELFDESLSRIKKAANSSRTYEKRLFYTASTDLAQPSIITYFNTNTQGRGKRIDLRPTFSVLSQSKSLRLLQDVREGLDSVLTHLNHIFILDPIPSNMRDYAALDDNLLPDAANIAGVLAALNEQERITVESVLTNYLSELPEQEITRVWTERIGKFNSDAMLYCAEQWNENQEAVTVDTRSLSDGTLRFLAIMTALLTTKDHSLLVIEEIDNGFHPSRADLLVRFLKEIGTQKNIDIICTTHNPALLDSLGNEMLAFISVVHRNRTTGISTITLVEDIEKLPRLLASGTIGRLSTSGILEETLN